MFTTPKTESTVSERTLSEHASILQEIALESLREKRRTRRWGIFFKLFFAVYFLAFLLFAYGSPFPVQSGAHTAVVKVNGVIGADADIDAERFAIGLQAAFENDAVRGVIVHINSPGGSAVQAARMYETLRRYRADYPDTPLYAVIEDLGASGGYYVAAGAEEIYADQSSLVGSIGVIIEGFGFVDTLQKLGVERRVFAAGKNKDMLDPFAPLDPRATVHAASLVDAVHEQFISAIRSSRGDRLADHEDVFSGLVFTGTQALELGLVDGFGSVDFVARELIGERATIDYTPSAGLLDRISRQLNVSLRSGLGLRSLTPSVKLQMP